MPVQRFIPPRPRSAAILYVHGGPGEAIDPDDPFMLRLLAEGRLNISHLITHVAPYTDAQPLFEMMLRSSEDWLGVVLQWPQ